MESIFMIVLFIIVAVLSDKMGTKKKVPRKKMPVRIRPELKIPDIKGAPVAVKGNDKEYSGQIATAEKRDYNQSEILTKAKELAYAQQRMAEEAQIRLAEKRDYEIAAKLVDNNSKINDDIMVNLNPKTARQAVVLAEILGRPRAYRHFRH